MSGVRFRVSLFFDKVVELVVGGSGQARQLLIIRSQVEPLLIRHLLIIRSQANHLLGRSQAHSDQWEPGQAPINYPESDRAPSDH